MGTIRIRCVALAAVLVLACTAGAETLQIVGNLPGTWIEISQTGTPLNIANDDVADINSAVGNAVFPAGTCHVGNNGGVGFGASAVMPAVTQAIPNSQLFNGDQALAPFADDIGDDGGNVFWSQQAVAGARATVLIIEWYDQKFNGSNDRGRFEIQIFSAPGPNHIYAQMLYYDIERPWPNGGAIATIGYQNGAAGFNDVQWSYHQAGAVANGTVLSLVPEPQALALLLMACGLLRRR
jgi:hypothetical protein